MFLPHSCNLIVIVLRYTHVCIVSKTQPHTHNPRYTFYGSIFFSVWHQWFLKTWFSYLCAHVYRLQGMGQRGRGLVLVCPLCRKVWHIKCQLFIPSPQSDSTSDPRINLLFGLIEFLSCRIQWYLNSSSASWCLALPMRVTVVSGSFSLLPSHLLLLLFHLYLSKICACPWIGSWTKDRP